MEILAAILQFTWERPDVVLLCVAAPVALMLVLKFDGTDSSSSGRDGDCGSDGGGGSGGGSGGD